MTMVITKVDLSKLCHERFLRSHLSLKWFKKYIKKKIKSIDGVSLVSIGGDVFISKQYIRDKLIVDIRKLNEFSTMKEVIEFFTLLQKR
jgi:hypothetical protein